MDIKNIIELEVKLSDKAQEILDLANLYQEGTIKGIALAATTKASIIAKASVLKAEQEAIWAELVNAWK